MRRDVLWGVAVLIVGVIGLGFGFGLGVYTDQAFPDALPYVAHHSAGKVDTTELQQAIRVIQAFTTEEAEHRRFVRTSSRHHRAAAGYSPDPGGLRRRQRRSTETFAWNGAGSRVEPQ